MVVMDYEALILARQEALEIWEDDPDSDYLTEEAKDTFEGWYKEENNE